MLPGKNGHWEHSFPILLRDPPATLVTNTVQAGEHIDFNLISWSIELPQRALDLLGVKRL